MGICVIRLEHWFVVLNSKISLITLGAAVPTTDLISANRLVPQMDRNPPVALR
jgi:hypothetical protein